MWSTHAHSEWLHATHSTSRIHGETHTGPRRVRVVAEDQRAHRGNNTADQQGTSERQGSSPTQNQANQHIMPVKCTECGGSTAWDDDAGSAICTTCGTLADPSQSILTSHLDNFSSTSTYTPNFLEQPAPAVLKSFRAGTSWALSGQGKEARDRKNLFAVTSYIQSLAQSVNAPGLSPRATALFNQALALQRFSWGRRAKLVAGACVAIALRESKRPDFLRDIAFLSDEPYPALAKTFTSVTTLLQLSLTSCDSSVHISSIHTHLSSVLHDPTLQNDFNLSPPTVRQLASVCLRTVAHTCTVLSTLLARFAPDHDLNRLPSPPTACAMFLLGIEAELREPLGNLGEVAYCLGSRCSASRNVIMGRYKLLQEQMNTWIQKVPWLTQYKRSKGRAQIGKRAIVAKGLKDVLQFQDELWRGVTKPNVTLDTSDAENDEDDSLLTDADVHVASQSPPPLKATSKTVKADRRKGKSRVLDDATQFLLDPLSVEFTQRMSKRPHAAIEEGNVTSTIQSTIQASRRPHFQHLLSLTSYILTAPSSSLAFGKAPTRLQLLSATRSVDDIVDEELFAEGELEGLFRSEAEIRSLQDQFDDWGRWDTEREGNEARMVPARKRRKKGVGDAEREHAGLESSGTVRRTSQRINLEALAQFLEEDERSERDAKRFEEMALSGLESFEIEDMACEDDVDQYNRDGFSNLRSEHVGEVVIDEWRPPTPDRYPSTNYEEQYD